MTDRRDDTEPERADERRSARSPGGAWEGVARTHVGLVRASNQDRFLLQEEGEGFLCAVADGMGGHAGGERASRIALRVFSDELDPGAPEEADLDRAVRTAHDAVRAGGEEDPDVAGMGTTLVGVAVSDESRVVFVNVGDSRLYHFRDGELRQISRDHSVVGDMVRRGEISPEEAESHPRRNVLTMALGIDGGFSPQTGDIETEPGDIFLLASDGLHGMISDRDISRILAAEWSLEERCNSLIEAALDAGGRDNVTVLLLQRGAGRARGGSGSGAWLLVPLLFLLLLAILRLASSDGGFGEDPPERYPVDSLLLEVERITGVGDSLPPDSLRGFPIDRSERILDSSMQPTPADIVGDSAIADSLEARRTRTR